MELTTLDTVAVSLNERLLLALARARARGQSDYQTAAQAEVHPSELSRWMHGHRSPSPAQAARVASALGCNVGDIFPINEQRPESGALPKSKPARMPNSAEVTGAVGQAEA